MPDPTKEELDAIIQRYDGLYSAIETRTSPEKPLLLAHYTSVQVAEQILKNEEIWFANPLYMNDLNEMRAGIMMASQIFPRFAQRAGGTADRAARLIEAFNRFLTHLATQTAIDTYIFCLSEHPSGDTDGLLSMWREYAVKGNGAALVFNTQKMPYQPHHPIVIAKVAYRSYTDQLQQLETQFAQWVQITEQANLPDDRLYLAAWAAFAFVKALALCTKHTGFAEEKEWRAIYVPERDPLGYLKSLLDYFVGPKGVEPKLKYKFG
jgi:hypothetical protein